MGEAGGGCERLPGFQPRGDTLPAGTCTNNQRDDCLQRDGTTVASCKDMAKTWLVPDSRKDGCWAPTGTPPTASSPAPVSSAPTPSPCPPQPLCDLMLSQ